MNKIRIVLVDDMEPIRNHFRMILSSEPDMEIVGEASSGSEAYTVVKATKPHIVIMDVAMETEMAGIEAAQKIKEEMDDVKIVMLTIHKHEELMFNAYLSGAMDYIIKTESVVEVIHSIKNVYNNKLNLRPEVGEKILGEIARLKSKEASMIETLNVMSKLTNAEYEVLKSLYNGKTYRQIARERFVEQATLRCQVSRIMKKFGKNRITDIIRILRQLNIFDIYS